MLVIYKMVFPYPKKGKITVYSKSGCVNCTRLKYLLNDKRIAIHIIDCDEFILNHKEEFLSFIQTLIGKEYKMFPIVFNNHKFMGGFNETYKFLEQLLDFDISF